MNVLSLFDGMSCGQIALNKSGIQVDKYYASEIDKYAISVTQYNYPDTIQLGDIRNWESWEIEDIDLILAEFPCQAWSIAGFQGGTQDERGQLMFTMIDIWKHISAKNPNVRFLFENVKMKNEFLTFINNLLGIKPIELNSSIVSAQNRKRLYWTNIYWDTIPVDKGIMLQDILEADVTDRSKSLCIDANYNKGGNFKSYFKRGRRQIVFRKNYVETGKSQQDRFYYKEGKICNLPASRLDDKTKVLLNITGDTLQYRKLSPLECERLQTVPENYTKLGLQDGKVVPVSNFQRYKMLGNGWTVDIICLLLEGIKTNKQTNRKLGTKLF